MKIAVVSDDQNTISQHFGRAKYYVVYRAENGKVLRKEARLKSVHHDTHAPSGSGVGNECHHGYGAGAHTRHKGMIETILDCEAMIAGGMGWGIYESLKNHNIDTVITDIKDMNQAVELYLKDNLPNLMQRIH